MYPIWKANLVLAALVGCGVCPAGAQVYPAKPVRIITAAPGATADILARHVSHRLAERFGQPFIVENRAGAAGIIAAEMAARGAPDGYTLHMGEANAQAIAISLHRKLPYDPLKDFAPITRVALAPFVFVVHASLPLENLQEFAAFARRHRGLLDYASAGNGTASHLTTELLKQRIGLDLVHVPFKGGAAASIAIVGGEVKAGSIALSTVWPVLKTGKVKMLAVTSRARFETIPAVPTVAEAGFPGFESATWFAMFAPARTPTLILERLHDALIEILQTPGSRAMLLAQGAEPAPTSPRELSDFVKSEIAKWASVAKAAGIRAE